MMEKKIIKKKSIEKAKEINGEIQHTKLNENNYDSPIFINGEANMDELWKVVVGFNNYECSNLGNIKNISNGRILGGTKQKGYIKYVLNDNDNNPIINSEHQLVARTWINNDENKPTVDHINRIRDDNKVSNLRWATYKEQAQNIDYENKKINNKKGVWKCDLKSGNRIQYYETIKDAAADMCNDPDGFKKISACALGTTKDAYKFKWEYVNIEDIENEEWKHILSIKKNNYYISNFGRLKNNNRLLKPTDDQGYDTVQLNGKYKRIHGLVAEAFIENTKPDKYNMVNHKDADRKNNHFSNLEWTDAKGNSIHATQNNLNKLHKRVINYDSDDSDDNILKIYTNCSKAGESLNVNIASINKCCKGKLRSCGVDKLKFKYLDDTDDVENMKIKPIPNVKPEVKKKYAKPILHNGILVYDRKGILIDTCKTQVEVASKYKVNTKTVSQHCSNKVKYHDIDYRFQYAI